MKKLLWVSRHTPLPKQFQWLRRKFGEISIDQYPNYGRFASAEEIVKYFRNGRFDEMVVVLPFSVIAKITEMGVQPLYAKMDELKGDFDPNLIDLEYNGRFYHFDRFARVTALRLEFEEI